MRHWCQTIPRLFIYNLLDQSPLLSSVFPDNPRIIHSESSLTLTTLRSKWTPWDHWRAFLKSYRTEQSRPHQDISIKDHLQIGAWIYKHKLRTHVYANLPLQNNHAFHSRRPTCGGNVQDVVSPTTNWVPTISAWNVGKYLLREVGTNIRDRKPDWLVRGVEIMKGTCS